MSVRCRCAATPAWARPLRRHAAAIALSVGVFTLVLIYALAPEIASQVIMAAFAAGLAGQLVWRFCQFLGSTQLAELRESLRAQRRGAARSPRAAGGAGAAVAGGGGGTVVVRDTATGVVTRIPASHLHLMLHDGDFTGDDYDTLLALDEANADEQAALHGATPEQIQQLPCYRYTPAKKPKSIATAAVAASAAGGDGGRGRVATADATAGVTRAVRSSGAGANGATSPRLPLQLGQGNGAPSAASTRVASAVASASPLPSPTSQPVAAPASPRGAGAPAALATAGAAAAAASDGGGGGGGGAGTAAEDDEHTRCAICLERYDDDVDASADGRGPELRMLPCMHAFHRPCIDQWLLQRATCPVCKVGIADAMLLSQHHQHHHDHDDVDGSHHV